MKLVRPLLITSAVLLVLVAAGIGTALTPSVQRWAVLRAVAGQPGLKLELTRISAGISRLTLEGLRVEQNGLVARATRIEAEYSLWPLMFDRRLELARVTADGLVVDASKLSRNQTGAATVGGPAAAPGILAHLELPYALVLTECRLAGQVLLAGNPGQPALPVDFQVTGGKFAPQQEGNLLVTATVKNPQPDAPVTQLKLQLNLRATQTDRRTFDQLALVAVADADGKTIAGQNQLKISTQLARQADGEHYTVSIDTLTNGQAENLLAVRAALATGATAYTGEWSLKARTAQVQAYLLGGALPEFSATGQGKFTFAPATGAVDCQGTLQAALSRLEAIEPAWRAIGAVTVDSRFDLGLAQDVASLRQLELTVAGAAPVLAVRATAPLAFNLREKRLQTNTASTGDALTVRLQGLPLAWVRPFVTAVDVSGDTITGEWAIAVNNEHLGLRSLQPLRVAGLTVVQQGRLLVNRAEIAAVFSAELAARDFSATLQSFTLKTPAGDALTLQGKVARPQAPHAALTASFGYQADLPQLLAPWVPLGRIQATGSGEAKLLGAELTLQALATTITGPQGPLLSVQSLRAFTANLDTLAVKTEGKAPADLMKIDLGRLSLATLPLAAPGDKVDGILERGEFLLSTEGDRLAVRAVAPVKVTGLTLTQGNQPMIAGLTVEALPRVEVGPAGALRLQSGDVTLRTKAAATLLTLKGEADHAAATGWRGALTFGLEIPQLATQPMFAGAQAVSAGRASGEVRLALRQEKQVEVRLTVNGLVDRATGQTLPVANLSFQAVVLPDGKITVKAPLLLDQAGQRSDVQVALELVPAGPTFSLDGRISGDQIELADLLALSAVFSSPSPAAAKPAVAAAPRGPVVTDTQPAWARFNGRLAVDIKSIHRGNEWAMTGLTGLVTVEPARVTLAKLDAAFGEKGRLAAQGEVKFAPGALPYQLAGKFSVTEFDAGRLFKALEPGKPVTVEGLFTVQGEFAGTGENPERLLERVNGQFALTSRQGVFRGLQRTTNKISKTTKAVELGASVLGSLLGKDNVTKAAEKVAGTAYFVDQLATELGEIKYDQLSVKLTRDAALNLRLEDISLVSQEVRLIGQGMVTYEENKPLLDSPLTASLSLASRGKVEELLGKLSWTTGSKDELGFTKTKETLTLTGTLSRPNPMSLFTRLGAAKLMDFLGGD
jgi:hypothetical protein